ncbi:cell surface protein [Methanosarcina barkeri 3]|uniref:Cell surface protein n=1 Tax=Methanosarcina barkeri 3 TaxID=1434107 RepID=A0A0E3SM33_METBA|nr:PKD domain-containing protein [Methanosarcina barkeri]AKB83211.1 cell surface protein [Methanosarcina barkeri 3]
MKTNKKLRSAVLSSTLLVLLLIVLSSTALASITETRITTHGTAANPDIYGNKIVWEDTSNGNSAIYAYDLSTKKETHITGNLKQTEPVVYGNKLVYISNGTDVYVYDLSTQKKTLLHSNPPFDVGEPAIYGNLIAWDYVMPDVLDSKIATYDLKTHQSDLFGMGFWEPAIYNKKIAYICYNDNNFGYDACVYDLSTSRDIWFTESGTAHNVDIYGNKVVWDDNRNGNWDIYMYDLSTKKETQITNHGTASNPAIYGNNIVWQDNRNGNWDIYAYDLKTHQQTHATVKSDQVNPAVYGNKIVWTDYRNGKPDIYMGTISYLPVAAFTASPTSGKYPLTVKFTDKSTDVYSYNWNFGDKSTSTVKNPTHKYTKAGKYTVSLTVKNAAGSNTVTKSSYINVAAPVKAPAASFTASPTSGKRPLKVQFTDKSTNSPTSWKWSFGDGTYSTSKNPGHTYSKSGKYTISLTVKNSNGSATKTVSGYITVK